MIFSTTHIYCSYYVIIMYTILCAVHMLIIELISHTSKVGGVAKLHR